MSQDRVQRRLAAILAADVVGYSRLMGADETGTLERLKSLRAEILDPETAAHNGRIVKTTGDGVLVEFASAVDAVQGAIAVQQALAVQNADVAEDSRIELRIGINLGDVIVEGDDIYGDGVNVAARLEGIANPGGIRISGAVHEQVKSKMETGFEDLGPHDLKNIAEPVRVYAVGNDNGSGAGAEPDPSAAEAMFARPAIAVLPFSNMSGDPEQEYFADGLTEDIITALSLWRSFPVIARNSTFAYKGTTPDIRKVGEELGARYVLEGSVRKSGSRVRVTGQLIDAETGHHVWAERLDRELDDIFDLQDELTARIAATVAPEIDRAEGARTTRKPPDSMDAWDYVQRGLSLLFTYQSKEGNAEARVAFEAARDIDPNYGRAHTGISLSHSHDLLMEFADSRDEAVAGALEAGERGVALDQANSSAHATLSVANMWPGRFDIVIAEGRRAVELNPNNAFARGILGTALDSVGETDNGIRELELSQQLNPQDPANQIFINTIARAHLIARRHEDAAEWARKSIDRRSSFPHAYYTLASALGHLGRAEEARRALDQCEEIQPGFVARRATWQPYRDAADNEHIHDGIQKAEWTQA